MCSYKVKKISQNVISVYIYQFYGKICILWHTWIRNVWVYIYCNKSYICSTCITFIIWGRVWNLGKGPTVGSRVERGAQIGGKSLIAFRGRVRTNTTENYRMPRPCPWSWHVMKQLVNITVSACGRDNLAGPLWIRAYPASACDFCL